MSGQRDKDAQLTAWAGWEERKLNLLNSLLRRPHVGWCRTAVPRELGHRLEETEGSFPALLQGLVMLFARK